MDEVKEMNHHGKTIVVNTNSDDDMTKVESVE